MCRQPWSTCSQADPKLNRTSFLAQSGRGRGNGGRGGTWRTHSPLIWLLLIVCLLCAWHLPSRNLSPEQGILTSKQTSRKGESEFCSGRRVREQCMQSQGSGMLEKAQVRGPHIGPGDQSREVKGKSVQNDHWKIGRCRRMKDFVTTLRDVSWLKSSKLLPLLSKCLGSYFPSQALICLASGFLLTRLRLLAHEIILCMHLSIPKANRRVYLEPWVPWGPWNRSEGTTQPEDKWEEEFLAKLI